QLTHAARAHAAARDGLDPDRVSFTVTLRAIRRAAAAARRRPSAAEILAQLLPARRSRSYPREIHASTATRPAPPAAPPAPAPSPPPSPSSPQTPTSPALKYAALCCSSSDRTSTSYSEDRHPCAVRREWRVGQP